MNDHRTRPNRPLRVRHQNNSAGQFAGLMSRVLPMMVLAGGVTWWMGTMQPALGQFPNQPSFSQAPLPTGQPSLNQSPPNFQTRGIPTIPSAAMVEANPQAAAPTEPASEPEPTAWQWPGLVQKIAQGGWLMVPLGICSLIVLTLSLERMVALRRRRVIPRPFVRRFTECVEDGQLSYDEATEICEEFDCPVAEVFRAAVRRWGRPMFEIEQAVMDAGDRVSDSLKRFLRVFHAISNVAPLLGLLGTVIGMIEAFDVISSQESIGRPETLASGISIALMTTAGGLSVAIPAYLAYMYFSSKSDSYLNEIDKLCQRVVDCISAEGLESNSNTRSSRKRRAA
ncbi:MAG: MotA/TolQ/ExbB proton channel family protein [Pirellulales bacterium]|nr:MotA/TolQ/ExbB proton channel family protein [Pirellulales bacterium]